MPGYAWSQKTPTDRHFGIEDCARITDALMRGLGYSEYAVQASLALCLHFTSPNQVRIQAGDWGSPVARELVTRYPACKGESNSLYPLRSH